MRPAVAPLPTNTYWSLYCQRSEHQVDGLTYSQAKVICLSLLKEDRKNWLAWHEGLEEWRQLSDFPYMLDDNRSDLRPVPPVARRPGLRPSTEEVVQALRPKKGKKFDPEATVITADEGLFGTADSRLQRRFHKKFMVEFRFMHAILKTRTIDISMGGMRVEGAFPPGTPSPFTAVLSGPAGVTLELQCALILDAKGAPCDRVKILYHSNEALFRKWLLS